MMPPQSVNVPPSMLATPLPVAPCSWVIVPASTPVWQSVMVSLPFSFTHMAATSSLYVELLMVLPLRQSLMSASTSHISSRHTSFTR